MVAIRADLDRVTVTCAGALVSEHRRCWDRHQSITDPAHRAAADRQRQLRRTITDLTGAPSRTTRIPAREVEVVTRNLSYYDQVVPDHHEQVVPDQPDQWGQLDQVVQIPTQRVAPTGERVTS